MPHIEAELCPFWDKHLSLSRCLDPRVDRGAAREKIECRGQSQCFFEHPVEGHRAQQIIGVVDTHVFDLRIDLILDIGGVRQMRNRPARE